MKQKCEKCDERGYVADTEYSRHSCECGWAIEQGLKKYAGISLEELMAYGHKRIIEKSK